MAIGGFKRTFLHVFQEVESWEALPLPLALSGFGECQALDGAEPSLRLGHSAMLQGAAVGALPVVVHGDVVQPGLFKAAVGACKLSWGEEEQRGLLMRLGSPSAHPCSLWRTRVEAVASFVLRRHGPCPKTSLGSHNTSPGHS